MTQDELWRCLIPFCKSLYSFFLFFLYDLYLNVNDESYFLQMNYNKQIFVKTFWII